MDVILPVKLFAAILFHSPEALADAFQKLETAFGPIDFKSPSIPFTVTDYYEDEMGPKLSRIIISFERLVGGELLADIKLTTIEIENVLKMGGQGRSVNIDSGYLDHDKVVLASTKKGAFKIYAQKNIWADMTLHYAKGHYIPFDWSFADFKDGRYEAAFMRIRDLYKKSLKARTT